MALMSDKLSNELIYLKELHEELFDRLDFFIENINKPKNIANEDVLLLNHVLYEIYETSSSIIAKCIKNYWIND